MALTRIVRVESEPELRSCHATDARIPFSATLSPAAEAVPRSNEDEVNAEAHFRAVLNTEVAWYSYELDATHAHTPRPEQSSPSSDADALRDHLMTWLEARTTATRRGHEFTSSRSPEAAVEIGSVSAGDTLRAARGWEAPIPRLCGLLHIVSVLSLVDEKRILVPYFEGRDPHDTIAIDEIDDDLVTLKRAKLFGGNEMEVVCQSGLLRPEPQVLEPVDPATGFLKVNEDAEDLWRTAQYLEDVSATQLWTTAAVQGVLSNDNSSALRNALGTEHCGVLRWLAVTGAASALDPTFIALLMPTDDLAEGHLRSLLVGLIMNSLARESSQDLPGLSAIDDARVRDSLKAAIKGNALLKTKGSESDVKRAAIVKELRRLHGLPENPELDATTADLTRLNSLLEDFQRNEPGPKPEPNADFPKDLDVVARGLGDLSARLGEEAGAERVVLSILRPLFSDPVVQEKIQDGLGLSDEEKKSLKNALETAWLSFESILNGSFDGAEAVRRSVGHAFQTVFARMANTALNLGEVLTRLKLQRFFTTRVLPLVAGATPVGFSLLTKELWRPDPVDTWLTIEEVNRLTEALDVAYEEALEALFPSRTGRTSVALNGDGTRVAGGFSDGTIAIWEVASEEGPRLLRGHASGVSGLAYSSNGGQLLSGSRDGTAKLWDTSDGRELRTLTGHQQEVTSVAVHQDGADQILATASRDGSIKLWKPPTEENPDGTPQNLTDHLSSVTSVAFSPDGSFLLSGSHDGTARTWNTEDGALLQTLTSDAPVVGVAVHPDPARKLVLTGSVDGKAIIWDRTNGNRVNEIPGPPGVEITSVEFAADDTTSSPPSPRFLTAGIDRQIRMWNADTGELVRSFEGHTERVVDLAINEEKTILSSGSWDGTVRLWRVADGQSLRELAEGTTWVDPEGLRLMTPAQAPEPLLIQIGDDTNPKEQQAFDEVFSGIGVLVRRRLEDMAETGEEADVQEGDESDDGPWAHANLVQTSFNPGVTTSVAHIKGGVRTASAGWDGRIRVWMVESGEVERIIDAHVDATRVTGAISALAAHPDEQVVASCSWDGDIKLWNVEDGSLIRTLSGHVGGVTCLAYSGDGARLVSGGRDKTVRVWNLQAGTSRVVGRHDDAVTGVAIDHSGKRVLSSSFDRSAKLWDATAAKVIHLLKGHEDTVTAAAMTSDGMRLATAGSDGTARLWDVPLDPDPQLVELTAVSVMDHGAGVSCVAFSENGSLLATGSHDQATRLWETASGGIVFTFADQLDSVTDVRFDFENNNVASSNRNGTLRFWSIQTGEWIKKIGPGVGEQVIEETAVRPFLPAAVDNRRAMFLEYNGLPLGTPAFDETRVRQEAIADEDLALRRPFYEVEDISAEGFAKVPRLAYASEFHTAAFAVTNGGTLPPFVRRDDDKTLPKQVDKLPDAVSIGTAIYQRRTAIGRVSLALEAPSSEAYLQAKTVVSSVHPLSADYPRQSVGSRAGEKTVLDIFRNSDGQGAIRLREGLQGTSAEIDLRDFEWWGSPGTLTVEVMQMRLRGTPLRPTSVSIEFGDGGGAKIDYEPGRGGSGEANRDLSIEVTPQGVTLVRGGKPTPNSPFLFKETLPAGAFWLRLTVDANKGGSASASFDDTLKADDPGNYYSRPEEPSRILMAPGGANWAEALTANRTLEIGFPRVGYLDFERWYANRHLSGKLDGRIESALLVAYALRGADDQPESGDGETETTIAELLERLPDPAVGKLMVTMLPEDRLTPPMAAVQREIIDVPTIDPESVPTSGTLNAYRNFLKEEIDKRFKALLEVSVSVNGKFELKLETDGGAITARVPEGMVARIQVRPLVASNFCEAEPGRLTAFDPGVSARAVQKIDEFQVFPGPDFVIETLTDSFQGNEENLRDSVEDLILCDTSGGNRAYSLRLAAELPSEFHGATLWRSLSHLDIASQQWRFSGRPIYNWPKLELPTTSAEPVIRLKLTRDAEGDAIRIFEDEAFFDRDNSDAGQLTKRIEALAAHGAAGNSLGSEVQRIDWESPTAMMFRHRFFMRSRYAGAMRNEGVKGVSSWQKDQGATTAQSDVWTYRVLVRAAHARAELNRPQLRALLPLTAPVNDSKGSERSSPPILAVVEEKPFVEGGLADRVLGVIHTGVHFGFPVANDVVQPEETRKEIGPNPRMSLRPMDEAKARRSMLPREGPVGLSFDADTASSPAWTNSQHLFTPRLRGAEANDLPNELHLGVSLMRILDPEWCDAPEERFEGGKAVKLSARSSWLITLPSNPGPDQVILRAGNHDVLKTDDRDAGVLRIWNRALDSYADETVWSPLSDIGRHGSEKIAILHQPLGEGRFRASVLWKPSLAGDADEAVRRIADGADSTFQVLASIPWSTPGKKEGSPGNKRVVVKPAPTISAPHAESVVAIAASAPTDMRWIKTVGDDTKIELAHGDSVRRSTPADAGQDLRRTVSMALNSISAKWDGTSLEFIASKKDSGANVEEGERLWLRGEIGTPGFPNATHRHLAAMFTRTREEPGRPTEVFVGSTLITGHSVKPGGPAKDVLGTGDASIRFLAFETPARPLVVRTSDVGGIRPEYRQAYFDQVSALGEEQPDEILIKVCLVRASTQQNKVGEFELQLHDGAANPTWTFSGDETDRFVDTVILTLRRLGPVSAVSREVDPRFSWSMLTIFNNGDEQDDSGGAEYESIDTTRDGFSIMLKRADGSYDELWADASCLFRTSVSNPESSVAFHGFDFDWVFSPVEAARGLELEVKPEALSRMTETQALVQRVSRSIIVESTESGES